MRPSAVLTTLCLLASITTAQNVTFRGQVEDVQGTQNQFVVDCSNVQLVAPAINLQTFVGLQTEITGTWNGSSVAPSVTVSAIQAVAESFEIGGKGEIGDELTFGVTGPVGRPTAMFASLGSTFAPLAGAGAVFIDLGIARPIASGIIPGGGNLQVKVAIPNNPNLVGTTVYGQAGILAAPGQIFLTNNDCKTLRN